MDFVNLLESFQIQNVADIRNFPGSKRYPHFNKELFSRPLGEAGILYAHFPELAAPRKPRIDSNNTGWRHDSFRAYAD